MVVCAYVVYTRCHITYTMVRAIESPRDRDREKCEVACRVTRTRVRTNARGRVRGCGRRARVATVATALCVSVTRHPSPVTRHPSSRRRGRARDVSRVVTSRA